MPTYLDNCIICGHDKFYMIEPYNSSRINSNYVACLNCGLVVMNPAPTEDELKEYYSGDYWELREGVFNQSLQKQHSRAIHIQKYIEINAPNFLKNVSSILEIGSSFGITLHSLGEYVKSIGGEAKLFAIEPSKNSVQIGLKYYAGANMIGGTLEELTSHKATFDLVILSHVLEHFTNPVASLIRIADKMAESSLCYMEVPNLYGHPSVEYAHNYCFTETSLSNILNLSYLEPIQIDSYFFSRMFPLYITCLARKRTKSDNQFKYIKKESVDEIIRQRKFGQVRHKGYIVLTKIFNHHPFQSIKYLVPNRVKRFFQYFI